MKKRKQNQSLCGVFLAVFTVLGLLTVTTSWLSDLSIKKTLFELGLALLTSLGVCWVIIDNRK